MYKRGARRFGIAYRNAVKIMEAALGQGGTVFDAELADNMNVDHS